MPDERTAQVVAALAAALALPGLLATSSPTSRWGAAGLVLGALSLYLIAPANSGPGRRVAGYVCAALVLFVAITSSAQAMGVGVDCRTEAPSCRSALVMALGLLPAACALLLLNLQRGRQRRAAEAFALAATVSPSVTLIERAYLAAVHGEPAAPDVSIAAALSLILLPLGILVARPDRGLAALVASERADGVLARCLLGPALAGPPLLGFLCLVATGDPTPRALQVHVLLATASAIIAVGWTLVAADTLERLDEARRSEPGRKRRDAPDEVARELSRDAGRDLDGELAAREHATERDLRIRVEALSEAATTITDAVARIPGTDLDALMMVVVLQAQALTSARYAAFGLGADPTRPFERWVHVGLSPEEVAAIGRIPRPVGVLGAVIRRGCPLRLRDVTESEEYLGFPPGHPRMRSFLGVPILYAGQGHGHLYLGDKQGADAFSAEDQHAIEFLATRAAAALEAARLYREEALAKTWLQGVLDSMLEAVLVVDAAGRLSTNRAAQEFLVVGDDQDGPLGFDLRNAADVPIERSDQPLTRALRLGETCMGRELFACREGGERVPVLVSASPLRDREERLIGAVSVLRDISTIKEAERLREQWTAIVAHDLRQPLSVISLSAQRLQRSLVEGPDDLVGKDLARIRGAVDRLSRMTRDLLDAARLDTHHLTVERAPVDLRALLAEVAARIGVDDHSRIRLDLPPAMPPVLADACRIEQVMENLLSNALKYGDSGSEVVVQACVEDDAVEVSTTNQGPTLTEDELRHLFTRFYRARPNDAVGGLGLGLYITRGLVEAHGGRIWAESHDHRTTFRFTLPVVGESGPARHEVT